MEEYPTFLFIENIESIHGIQFLRTEIDEATGIAFRFYQSRYGTMVMIETTDETMPIITCKDYLRQLGANELIAAMFVN